ncbi:MAG: cytochrome biogenesis protein ResB [Wenzhouxiangella sp.]|nr:MAG: cytochrome biogenesis protein ResB [Wenzhouxiangella sp.]
MQAAVRAIAVAALMLTGQASAQHGTETLPEALVEAFEAMQGEIARDPEARLRVIEAGRERAAFCNTCHGPDGSATRVNYPSLASQNPVYLLDQIEQFANGSREKLVMNVLAETFSVDEKVTLALYYSEMTLQAPEADLELARRGAPVYQARCATCHGSAGLGEEGYARIAGQQPGYVANVLREYRSGDSPRRFSVMYGIASGLGNDDIDAVAHYIASLR